MVREKKAGKKLPIVRSKKELNNNRRTRMKNVMFKFTDSYYIAHTNWMPVSLRIPTPAEAKFAPTRSLSPVSSGDKYGNVGSIPNCSP